MNIQKISNLIEIINREKNTSSIIFTLNKRNMDLKNISIEHSYLMLNLAQILSTYSINIEIEEPNMIIKDRNECIRNLIDDMEKYSQLISAEDDTTKSILVKLINIKSNIIRNLLDIRMLELELSLDELLKYDGSDGKPAYVAIAGIIYDVSDQKSWNEGTHYGLVAGRDLTDEFNSCHEEEKNNIISKLTPIGKLKN